LNFFKIILQYLYLLIYYFNYFPTVACPCILSFPPASLAVVSDRQGILLIVMSLIDIMFIIMIYIMAIINISFYR
jgi:hypothetical protein